MLPLIIITITILRKKKKKHLGEIMSKVKNSSIVEVPESFFPE